MSDRLKPSVYVRLTRREDFAILAPLYVRSFAEPPWGEENDEAEVLIDFERYIKSRLTVFSSAVTDQTVVGAAVAFPIWEMPSVSRLLSEREREDLYMAELFVAPTHRQRRAGYLLTLVRMVAGQEMGFRRFTVRTSIHQPAIIRLYTHHFGATIAAHDEVISPKLIDGHRVMAPDTRVILVGDIPK